MAHRPGCSAPGSRADSNWSSRPCCSGSSNEPLAHPKLAERIKPEETAALIDWLRREAVLVDDPVKPPTSRSEDPGDDYLLALAEEERAVLVSGDRHLPALAEDLPVLTTREFLVTIGAS